MSTSDDLVYSEVYEAMFPTPLWVEQDRKVHAAWLRDLKAKGYRVVKLIYVGEGPSHDAKAYALKPKRVPEYQIKEEL